MSLLLALHHGYMTTCSAPMHVLRHIRNNFFWLLATATRGNAGPLLQCGELEYSRQEGGKG